MKQIPLTQNKFALVDDEDFEALMQHKWYFSNGYAFRELSKPRKVLPMSKQVLKTERKVDHKDLNKLNNQKQNLRFCTASQNIANRKPLSMSNGVYAKGKKWIAEICKNEKRLYLGSFLTRQEAVHFRNEVGKELFGEFFIPKT